MKTGLFLILLLVIHLNTLAQKLPGAFDELRLLEFNKELPKDLLSTRSAVFITVPDKKGKLPQRGDWQLLAREAHEGFKRIGIDAVAYLNLQDVNAGLDAIDGFIVPINNRDIENLIFLSLKEGLLGTEIELVITKRPSEGSLLNLHQPAYRISRNAIGEIIAQLGRDIYQVQLQNHNFMILDQPEFFSDAYVVKGRRFESFNSDLKIGKLAVPKFEKFKFPPNVDSASVSSDKLSLINQYNALVENANQELLALMAIYPYKYELVDYSVGEEHLYRQEFSYVLMSLNSTGINIKNLLNYTVDPNETDYLSLKTIAEGVTTLEQIPVNTPVFKYYMKQLVNKEIYLGKQWDADLTWQQALTNYLNNFKDAMEEKNK